MSSPSDANAGIRYHFGPFVLSPAQRLLLRDGVEVRLIPRYFDLLRLLIERRDEAVHRQEIFDRVWADVIVSDGALSQAIRTLRRALGDDPREPVFIRTVSRHGYQFVFSALIVEPVKARTAGPGASEGMAPPGRPVGGAIGRHAEGQSQPADADDALDALVQRLLDPLAADGDLIPGDLGAGHGQLGAAGEDLPVGRVPVQGRHERA